MTANQNSDDWKKGMEKIGDGVYVDTSGALHIDEAEICRAAGCAPTRRNCMILRNAARRVAKETWPGMKVEEV